MTNFRDGCLSNNHLKPWKNFDIKVFIFLYLFSVYIIDMLNTFFLKNILGYVKFLEGQE